MAGHTGRMTREAIALVGVFVGNRFIGAVISQPGAAICRADAGRRLRVFARSYSLRSLLGIWKGLKQGL